MTLIIYLGIVLLIMNTAFIFTRIYSEANQRVKQMSLFLSLLIFSFLMILLVYYAEFPRTLYAFPALTVLLAILYHPLGGFFLFIISIPITEYLPRLDFFTSLTATVGAVTFLAFLLNFPLRGLTFRRVPLKVLILLFGFLFSVFCSAIFGRVFYTPGILTYVQLVFLFLLVTQMFETRDDIEFLMWIWILIMGAVEMFGLMNFDFARVSRENRLAGLVNNANLLSFNAIISTWFITYFLLKKQRSVTKAGLILFICLDVVSVIFSVSRTGIMGFAFTGMMALYVLRGFFKPRTFLWLIIASFALVGILINLNLQAVWNEMSRVPDLVAAAGKTVTPQLTMGNSFMDRVMLWQNWLAEWSHHPIFGVGVMGTQLRMTLRYDVPHNSFISILVELGLFGLVLFVQLVWRAWWWTGFKQIKTIQNEGLNLNMTWWLVLNTWIFISMTNSLEFSKFFWIILAVMVVLRNINDDEEVRAGVSSSSKDEFPPGGEKTLERTT